MVEDKGLSSKRAGDWIADSVDWRWSLAAFGPRYNFPPRRKINHS
jgi:hypothetical protein